MLIEVCHVHLPVSDALQQFARRHVQRALRPFQESIERVEVRLDEVRLEDVNGAEGGVEQRCTVTAALATGQRTVVIGTGADALEASQAACARLGESVSRDLAREGRLDAGSARDPVPAEEEEEEGRIQITAVDHQRLRTVIDGSLGTRDQDAAEALADELDRAEVVEPERVAGNVVTMNSRVVFDDLETGEAREVSLVYPRESDAEQGRISVLAPVGSALLGLAVGQTIDWPLPRGRVKRLRIAKVVYQPEEAGHFHL